jgi:hypothetical protein
MSTKAQDRRYEGINALCTQTRERRLDGDEKPYVHWSQTLRDQKVLASRIRDLKPLGRTQRWTDAVEVWAVEVEQADNESTFHWAFDQFAIYASYAAE